MRHIRTFHESNEAITYPEFISNDANVSEENVCVDAVMKTDEDVTESEDSVDFL
jgi:hypothetical protein